MLDIPRPHSLPLGLFTACLAIALMTSAASASAHRKPPSFTTGTWQQLEDHAPWAARAGLQVVEVGNRLYLMGGRTPNESNIPGDSRIWSDVWTSADQGRTWSQLLASDGPAHWAPRAYFQALQRGREMFVLGGQDFALMPNPGCPTPAPGCPPFISVSRFFDDVWSSTDGVHWTQLSDSAGWEGRAGLSAAVLGGALYVAGGSKNDDSAIIGGPPARIYFNDVWRSTDGRSWTRMTEQAPWAPRAGGILVAKDDYLYMIGGEAGFLCGPPPCTLPYFNDVWRSRDGRDWERVTASAEWSPRPGHQVAVVRGRFYLFGGFGLPVNPQDVWESGDGAHWRQVSDAPWNAVSPAQVKYDFDVVVSRGPLGPQTILTFGGDRETFDFGDPGNFRRVDNDVWKFVPPFPPAIGAPAGGGTIATLPGSGQPGDPSGPRLAILADGSRVFTSALSLSFQVPGESEVELALYDAQGRHLRTLARGVLPAGVHRVQWDGRDDNGRAVEPGVYFARLRREAESATVRLVRLR